MKHNNTKSLDIVKIENLENMNGAEFAKAMELHAPKHIINEVNWPKDYPYCPSCCFSIARSDKALAIVYHVSGLDLRSMELETNGHMWEDSCCEFFMLDPDGKRYYNFEMNCAGVLLSASGEGRENRVQRSLEEMAKIRTFSTLDKVERDEKDVVRSWSTGVIIPMEMVGINPENLPEKIKGNFYKCGDKTAHMHFVSWNRIDIEKPDFHRPDFFGDLFF